MRWCEGSLSDYIRVRKIKHGKAIHTWTVPGDTHRHAQAHTGQGQRNKDTQHSSMR